MSDETELTKAMVVNWALVELGMSPTFTTDDATTLGGVVDIFWPRCEAICFGLHDWTFNRKTFLLTRQAETPVTGYAYGFDLPGGRLGEPRKFLSDPRRETPVRDTRIEANTVFADEPVLYAVCTVRVAVSAWDPMFADAFAVALAAQLAVPLLQDVEMAGDKEQLAFGDRRQAGTGGRFGRLIAQNLAAHPKGSPFLREDPLTAARW